jgi:hypothetical protein
MTSLLPIGNKVASLEEDSLGKKSVGLTDALSRVRPRFLERKPSDYRSLIRRSAVDKTELRVGPFFAVSSSSASGGRTYFLLAVNW